MFLPVILLPLLVLTEAVWAAVRTKENTCPQRSLKNDYKYLQLKGDYCYRFVVNHKKEYSDANKDCQRDGGLLALPKTRTINNFLVDQLRYNYKSNDPVWIGLHDKSKEGTFVWEDHKGLGWSHFARGNGPGHGGATAKFEDCVALHPSDSNWHDYQCKGTLISWFSRSKTDKHYVCEYTTDLPDEHPPAPKSSEDANTDVTVDDGNTDVTDDDGNTDVTVDDGNTDVTVDDGNTDVTVDDGNTDVKVDGGNTDVTVDDGNTDVTVDDGNTDATVDDESIDEDDDKTDEVCPPFICSKDCGWYGYVTDLMGCALCECPTN